MKFPTYDDLSREQLEIHSLPLEGSYLVTGPPGTGKTVMAVYRAEMLAQTAARTQLLMYSRLLCNYIRSAIDELDLDGVARTYDSWIRGFYQGHYKKRLPEVGPWKPDWPEILKTLNSNPPPQNSIPFLIVDEAQDLPKHFFMVSKYLARHLTVFADENQKLHDENSTLNDIETYAAIPSPRFTLARNYRNTQEIASLAACFFTGLSSGIPDPPERSGDKPELVQTKDIAATVAFIARYEKNNPQKEIGVLTPTRALQKKFVNRLTGKTTNPVQFYDGRDPQELDFDIPGIKVVNYPSAKGLEFDTVFLPELQAVRDDPNGATMKMRFYVLLSRARDALFLMYSGDDTPPIVDAFPSKLLTIR